MDGEAPAELMRPAEVALALGIDVKTVARWTKQGKLRAVRTLGGHRRYFADEVRTLVDAKDSGPSTL